MNHAMDVVATALNVVASRIGQQRQATAMETQTVKAVDMIKQAFPEVVWRFETINPNKYMLYMKLGNQEANITFNPNGQFGVSFSPLYGTGLPSARTAEQIFEALSKDIRKWITAAHKKNAVEDNADEMLSRINAIVREYGFRDVTTSKLKSILTQI